MDNIRAHSINAAPIVRTRPPAVIAVFSMRSPSASGRILNFKALDFLNLNYYFTFRLFFHQDQDLHFYFHSYYHLICLDEE